METVMRLGVIFRLVDRFSGPMRAAGRAVGRLRESLRGLSRQFRDWGTKALVIGGSAGLALMAPAHAAGKFEAEMAAVGAMTNATGAQMRQLERTAIQLGIETEHSPQAAAEAFRALSSQGLTLDQQFKAIRPTLRLATAGQLQLAEASTTTASALNAFQLGADQTQRVVDVLMKATTISALRADEYQLALGTLGAEAGAANQDFEQMVAVLGAFRSKGLTAQDAAFKIKMALIALKSPTSEAQKLIDKLGIRLRDQKGNMLPFTEIVDNIQGAIKGLNKGVQDQVVETLLGRRAATAFQLATQAAFTLPSGEVLKGTDAIRAMTGALKDSAGAADKFASTFLDTFRGKVQLLKGSFETLNLVMGKHVAGVLKPYAIQLTGAFNAMIAWVQTNPKAARELAQLGVIVATATLGLGALLMTLWAITTALSILLSPATLAIIAVGALAAGVYLLAKNWNAAINWIENRMDDLRSTVADGVAWLLEKIASVADALPTSLLPSGLRPGVLRATAAGLREGNQPGRRPEEFRLPSIGEVMGDLGLAPLAEMLKAASGGEQGRTINIQNVNLHGVQDSHAVLDGLEQAAAGMAPQE